MVRTHACACQCFELSAGTSPQCPAARLRSVSTSSGTSLDTLSGTTSSAYNWPVSTTAQRNRCGAPQLRMQKCIWLGKVSETGETTSQQNATEQGVLKARTVRQLQPDFNLTLRFETRSPALGGSIGYALGTCFAHPYQGLERQINQIDTATSGVSIGNAASQVSGRQASSF